MKWPGVSRNETANAKSFQARMNARIAGREHARDRDRDHDPAQRDEPRRAVDERRLLEVLRDLHEEVAEQVGRDRQRVDEVDDDQRLDAVEEAEVAQHEEQRADHRQHREEAGDEDEREDRAGAADRQPRERVAGQRRDDDRDQRRRAGDDRAVDERRQEALLGEVLAVGAATSGARG